MIVNDNCLTATDLTSPTTQHFYNRELVRECLERRVSMYNHTSYKQIAHWLKLDYRTVKRHIAAIRGEHGLG